MSGTLDELDTLVEVSLLKAVDQDRFLMLETIREFAAERLEESGETAALERAFTHHMPRYPVYRSIGAVVDITTSLELESS